ncbi:MAG: immune inhibitor A [Actinomycetota bacterium]|nr:immune inhibitor A [Actinomycetota bacterium]MDQ2957077.1 immune inhibitor A [Actinomycetota bacterium]
MQVAHARLSRRIVVGAVAVLAGATALTAITLAGGNDAARAATPYKVLFDNSHAETSGQGDWIISTSQPDPLGQNANPTSESSWTGGISAWGVALQQTGRYSLKTLPSGSSITYGGSGAQDLKNFNAFVLPEPNVVLTAAEKTAIMTFVQNGGGLFMVSDHTGSDRNNDGWDSPKILNDLMTNNSVDSTDPFGFSIDLLNIGTENPNVIGASAGSDPIIKGPFGTATGTIIRNGTTVTLKPGDNSSVRGEIFRTGYSASGTTGAAVATSTFGAGRVMFIGDSSTIDDGTGESGNTLYNGWNDPAGTDSTVMLNGTEWLASGSGGGGGTTPPPTTTPPAGGEQLTNGGFESGTTGWTLGGGAAVTTTRAHAGTHAVTLGGTNSSTQTLTRSVNVPAGISSATFSFWTYITTTETTHSWDFLTTTVKNSSGTVLKTVSTQSDAGPTGAWSQTSADLSAYAGQTVTLSFSAVNGTKNPTTFSVDDVSLLAG